MTRRLLYQARTDIFAPLQQPAVPVQLFAPLSEPRRIAVAAAVLAASGAFLPPQPATVAPAGWRAQLFEPARAQRQRFQAAGVFSAPQPPVAVGAPPQGWHRALAEPLFQPQSVRTRSARVSSAVYCFPTPVPPPPAPAMAFYRQLSYPVFAQIHDPGARIHWLAWSMLPPPIVIPPLWAPQGPDPASWTGQAPAPGIWTPQLPGTTAWTDQ